MTTDKNNAAPDLQPAELAEQQGNARLIDRLCAQADLYSPGELRSVLSEAAAALAATGKQQVGEVQGDAPIVLPPMPHGQIMLPDDRTGDYPVAHDDEAMQDYAREAVEADRAARQPGAQEELHGFLKNSTPLREAALRALGFIDRNDEHGRTAYDCLRRELHAECAAPPAQGIDLGQLRSLAEKFESYGDDEIGDAFSGPYYQCATELRGLIDDQRDAAPGVSQ